MADNALQQGFPLVVKIGGSLVETGRVKDALAAICDARRPVVIVPGGGAFADKVRDLQLAVRFDDAAAHRLAMLGMHQMAEVFTALDPRLQIADSLEGMSRVLAGGDPAVWVPLPMMDADRSVPANWSTTSDSLAARLGELLGGAPLVLLKSVDVDPGLSAEDLARDGIVDAAFPSIISRSKLWWRALGPGDDDAFRALLRTAETETGLS